MYVPYDTQIWAELASLIQQWLGVPIMVGLIIGVIIFAIRLVPSLIRLLMSFFG